MKGLNKASLFIAPHFRQGHTIRLLEDSDAKSLQNESVLFKQVPEDFGYNSFSITSKIEECDFILIPQAFKKITKLEKTYLLKINRLAQENKKPIIVFLSGDFSHRIVVNNRNTIVFTASEYKHSRKNYEVVFAPFTEDLGGTHGLTLRKKGGKPVVSFCGYAGYSNLLSQLKSEFLHLFLDITGRSAYKRGIAFRKKSIHVLANDSRLHTNFIVRDFFSGNINTINANTKQIRDEYIDSIQNTDFVLCPKGDANYSSRFYETLSLGRIPILIDTDMVLPFEKQIDYSKFIVRVPYADINQIGDYVMRLWDKLSPEEYSDMQKHAREVYRNYLRFDAYFNKALPLLKEGGVEAVL